MTIKILIGWTGRGALPWEEYLQSSHEDPELAAAQRQEELDREYPECAPHYVRVLVVEE